MPDELEAYISSLTGEEKAALDLILGPELTSQNYLRTLPRGWSPRDYQCKSWNYLENGGLRACLIWHRRAGKDDLALNWTAVAAHRRIGEYWHMLPEASQARKAIWDAVNPHTGVKRVDQAFPPDLRKTTRNNEMVIEFECGSLWRVVGSDNYDSLVGSTPIGIVFSEWALADPNAWAFLRPILLENRGWAIFITTPRGANHAKKTLDLAREDPENWFAEILPAEQTGVFTPQQLTNELREYQHDYGDEEGKALFEQEYNCSFESALIGSFYGAFITRAAKEGRITDVPLDRGSPVHTSWDLGVGDSTAIWFVQRVGSQYRLIDYHEASGLGLDEYARILEDRRQQHRWVYGKDYFPHDMADRELGNAAKSRASTWRELTGRNPIIVPRHHDMDGVNAVRRMLDSTYIHETRCDRGLNALRNFRRVWDDKLKMFRDNYFHDWASHGAKALESFACGHREMKPARRDDRFAPQVAPLHERGTGWMAR